MKPPVNDNKPKERPMSDAGKMLFDMMNDMNRIYGKSIIRKTPTGT